MFPEQRSSRCRPTPASRPERGVAYERHPPVRELRPFVDGIWVQEDPHDAAGRDHPQTRVLPTGVPELLLHFRDPFERRQNGSWTREPVFGFAGQRTRSIRVRATGRTGIILVRFHPWGAAPFVPPPLGELRDRVVDMAEIAGHRASEVRERAQEARSNGERVRLLQELLLRLLDAGRTDPLVIRCAWEMKRRRGAGVIGRIAAREGISRRQLARRFRAGVGLAPKRFSGLLRFQESIGLRRAGWSWAAVAQACGLHDQAHLIRLWRGLAGEAPGRAMDGRVETALGRFFRSGRSTSHFYNTTHL